MTCKRLLAWVTGGATDLLSNVLVNILTVTHVEILQGVRNMEGTPSSEHFATAGSNNDRDTVHDGVGMDAKW